MSKKRFTAYISDTAETFLTRFPPMDKLGGSVNFIIEWAAEALRQGAIQGINILDVDERKAILASVNGYMPITETSAFVARLEDWFKMDEGAMWGWDEDKIKVFIKKLKNLSSPQLMGVILWGKGFREEDNLDVYLTDFSGLFSSRK